MESPGCDWRRGDGEGEAGEEGDGDGGQGSPRPPGSQPQPRSPLPHLLPAQMGGPFVEEKAEEESKSGGVQLWPGGVVPYEIDASLGWPQVQNTR